jgi:pyridoxal biosynthesis lyase PdxS
MQKTLLILAGSAWLLGCSHAPAPTDQVASSLAAVRAAEEAGAAQLPEAELHMKLAREQIAQAEKLMSDDHNAKARDKAMRARNDAELALSLTHEQAAKSKLSEFKQAHPTSGGEGSASEGAAR